jgi:hypothetical protein
MTVPAPRWMLVLGWLLAFVGGIIGLLIGVHLRNAKITDLDGKKGPKFNEASRQQGLYIMIVSIVMLIVWTIVNIASR